MSRHRTVRSMNYQDEYDGYDDVYGHSVEDDSYCVSPSTAAQFLYDRTQQPSLSSYMKSQENEEIPEENEDGEDKDDCTAVSSLHDSFHFHQLGLNATDEARLKTCLDEMRNILGESVHESVMVDAILRSNFDSNAAADDVLGQQTHEIRKPQKEPREGRKNKDEARSRPTYPEMNTICANRLVTSSSMPMQTDNYEKHPLLSLSEMSLHRIIEKLQQNIRRENCCAARKMQQAAYSNKTILAKEMELVKEFILEHTGTWKDKAMVPAVDYKTQSEKKGVSNEKQDSAAYINVTAALDVLSSQIWRNRCEAMLSKTSLSCAYGSSRAVSPLCQKRTVSPRADVSETDSSVTEYQTERQLSMSVAAMTESHDLRPSTSAGMLTSHDVRPTSSAATAQERVRTTLGLLAAASKSSLTTGSSRAAMASQHISRPQSSADVSLVTMTTQAALRMHRFVTSLAAADTSQTALNTAAYGGSLLPTVTSQPSGSASAKSSLAALASQHLSDPDTLSHSLTSDGGSLLAKMASQHFAGQAGSGSAAAVSQHTHGPLTSATPSLTLLATQHCAHSVSSDGLSQPLITSGSLLASQHISGPVNAAALAVITTSQHKSEPQTSDKPSLTMLATQHSSNHVTSDKLSLARLAMQHHSSPVTSDGPSLAILARQRSSDPLTSDKPSLASLAMQRSSDPLTSDKPSLALQHSSDTLTSDKPSLASLAMQRSSDPLTSDKPSLASLTLQHSSDRVTSVSSRTLSQSTCDDTQVAKMASGHISESPNATGSLLAAMVSRHQLTESEFFRFPMSVDISETSDTSGLAMAIQASRNSISPSHTSQLEKVTSGPVDVTVMHDSIHRVSPVRSAATHVEKPKVKPPPGFPAMSASHMQIAQFTAAPSSVDTVVLCPPPGFHLCKQTVDLRQLLGIDSLQTPCPRPTGQSPRKEHRRHFAGQMFAKPSLFGATLCTSHKPRALVQKHPLFPKFMCPVECQKGPEGVQLDEIVRFEFLTPSPDDIVKEKQKAAFINPGERAKQDLQRTTAPLSVTLPSKATEGTTGLTPTVARMTFTGIGVQSETEGATDGTRLKSRVENTTRESGDKSVPIKKSWSSSNLESGKGDQVETPGRSGTKSKAGKLDLVKEYEKRKASDDKENLNMVVIGHVDAGKSTLMGHVLYQLGFVNKKTMHKYEQESRKLGKASFAYAWVLDETAEERSRGVTMDVAQTRFETKSRIVTLLDAPGHKDFIPNMITGAAQADVAILVVNATRGEFETGFESGGQTREHAMLIRSLGVSQLVVAINKMDTVGWLRDRYEEIVKKLAQFLKQAGFKETDIAYIPCSGLAGENLTSAPTVSALATWYNGPTLVQQIDNFKLPERQVSKPLRMCVVDVFKGMGSGFSVTGVIHAGAVQPGDRLLVMPQGEMLTVKGVLIDDLPMQCAFAGDCIVLTVTGIDMSNVTVGSILCLPNDPIKAVTRFRARIVLLNIDVPITKGFPVVFHYLSTSEPAHIHKLISLLHKSTGEVVKKKPRCLVKNSSAVIELQLDRPVCIELYKDFKALGRFMLRYAGSTIAAGLITEITGKKPTKND